MALPGEIGWIGKDCPTHAKTRLIASAMQSNAGWYLGTYCERCREEDPSPHSRESGYYPTKQELIDACYAGTVTWRDTQYRPMKLLNNTDALAFDFAKEAEPVTDFLAVICPIHSRQFLTQTEYDTQMNKPNALWECPKCHRKSYFDDSSYEAHYQKQDKTVEEQRDEVGRVFRIEAKDDDAV